jgi:hypothetical protein
MKKIFVVIILFVLSFGTSFSQETNYKDVLYNGYELNFEHQKNLELQNKIIYNGNRFSIKDSLENVTQEVKENPNKKSTLIGGVLSGLLPGAGQFYAKTYIKSAAFLAVEAGLWIAYAVFQKKGNDQTDYFQNYANQNWDMRRYGAWLKAQNFPKSSDINLSNPDDILRAQINACEEVNFSHTLPPWGEQQYYEVIGKYKNFTAGWSDPNAGLANNSPGSQYYWANYSIPQVSQYMIDRQQANTYYDRGSTMLTVVILNHLLSAADGVWSVMRYNSKFDIKPSVSFQSHYSYYQQKSVIVPHFNLCVSF